LSRNIQAKCLYSDQEEYIKMRLTELIDGLDTLVVTGDAEVQGLSSDSRTLRKGDLFFAIKGEHHEGRSFISDAIARGAVAVVTDTPLEDSLSVPLVVVRDIHEAIAFISDRFYGHPSSELKVIGVTGTNGKTTTSSLLCHILTAAGYKTGLIGTVRYMIRDNNKTIEVKKLPPHTTPDAIHWQGLLRMMRDHNVKMVVSEVSSHALSLKRVDYTEFYLSIFTNLSRDHLDFHGDMESYYQSKMRLFRELTHSVAIFNTDDPYCQRAAGEPLPTRLNIITCGTSEDADFRVSDICLKEDGIEFCIKTPAEEIRLQSELVGMPNVYNIALAVVAALQMEIKQSVIQKAIREFQPVEGRLQMIKMGQDFSVVIDYAHTPDALQNAILAMRPLTKGRLITVFGCGGNRDRGKRPLMGEIATELSDLVIVTSDNPRNEPPAEIIKDIVKGIKKKNYMIIEDRREAIFKAVSIASSGDMVIVAGKGHEEYQEIEGVKYPFSDRATVVEAIKNRLEAVNC
jgi:UDP-N-acetylmuramoyl-L-alanyl-D-glutamate--2,6-diaminopimelate ligase